MTFFVVTTDVDDERVVLFQRILPLESHHPYCLGEGDLIVPSQFSGRTTKRTQLHMVIFATSLKRFKKNKTVRTNSTFCFVPLTSDIDECSADSSPCDENADCTNSDGSYSCTCKQGFIGDGSLCDGLLKQLYTFSS